MLKMNTDFLYVLPVVLVVFMIEKEFGSSAWKAFSAKKFMMELWIMELWMWF